MEHLSAVVARQTHIDNPQDQEMMERIVDAICQVYDPEIPVNIWELGLIYTVHLTEEHDVFVDMTLTTPMCPERARITSDGRDGGLLRSRRQVVRGRYHMGTAMESGTDV